LCFTHDVLQKRAASRRWTRLCRARRLGPNALHHGSNVSTPRIEDSDSFNPAFPGTQECAWLELLAREQRWAPRKGPLLVVSPHPDDEVLGAGGLMRMWSARSHPVTVLSVTDGEAAYPAWPDLNVCRRRELDRALHVLSPNRISTVRLGLRDGGVTSNISELMSALAMLCVHRPTLIAPYERDGHPDHEAVGETCLRIARDLKLPIARYPIWAWHHAHPRDFDRAVFGCFALDAAALAVKADAIDCFASQVAPAAPRVPIVPAHVLDYFKRDFEAFLL
jgi:LmbE family N-acetylglucosaminyl deacetylase